MGVQRDPVFRVVLQTLQPLEDDERSDAALRPTLELRDPSDEPAPAPASRVPAGPPPGPSVGPRREMPPEAQAGGAKPAAKVGRNDPCPCGSGRKYKKCHGAAA